MSLKDRIPARTSYNFLLWFLTATFMLLTAAQLFGQLEDREDFRHCPRYVRCSHS